jgi:hypothetical protein
MHEFVHVPAEEVLVTVEAEQAETSRIGERAIAVEVYTVDALTRRVEQQLG